MTALDGTEIEFSNLNDKSNTANHDQQKFTEFFLEGSIPDQSVDIVKQRLKAICDNNSDEEFHETEFQYVLGDAYQLPGLVNRPSKGGGKKGRGGSHSSAGNKDDSLDVISQSPGVGSNHPIQSPMSVGSNNLNFPPSTPSGRDHNTGPAGAGTISSFRPVSVWITKTETNHPHQASRPLQVKYYGKLQEKGDPNNRKKGDKPCLIRPAVISNCTPGIIKLLKECWDFKLNVEFTCKGFQYCKAEYDLKRDIRWLIKVRLFKIKQKSQTIVTDNKQGDKVTTTTNPQQTGSYLLNVSLLSPFTGNREMMTLAANVVKNFSDQLKPLVNLEKIY